MNKDALLATLIGFAIGLVITGVLLAGPSMAKYLPHINLPKISLPSVSVPGTKAKPTAKPTPTTFGITIDSPIAETIEDNKDLLISGKTSPGATVVIQGNVDDAVIIANNDGQYAEKITLEEGRNDITVTSYTKSQHATQMVTVYYTPESL